MIVSAVTSEETGVPSLSTISVRVRPSSYSTVPADPASQSGEADAPPDACKCTPTLSAKGLETPVNRLRSANDRGLNPSGDTCPPNDRARCRAPGCAHPSRLRPCHHRRRPNPTARRARRWTPCR
eukprot:5821029-Prymnesium_polylepis.2